MAEMIEVGAVLRALEDAAWGMIEQAMAADAIVADVGAAAAAVHVTASFRRKFKADSPDHDRIDAEYLACLSARLQEIDEGDDLGAAMAAAALIAGKPVRID